MNTPKRFIAGAVCPRCGKMDKIMMYTTDEGQFRECVACDFSDGQADIDEVTPELQTRVNARNNNDDHTVRQVVFFRAAAEDNDEE